MAAVGVAATGFALGSIVGWGFETAYENNFLGIRGIANEMGDNLEKDVKNVGDAIDSGIKSIQKVFGW